MSENDKFLDAYRTLEDALNRSTKLNASSVLDYENELQRVGKVDASEKLKVCRITRNYMTHHADGKTFLGVSPKMTKYLLSVADSITKLELSAAKVARKVPVLSPSTSMKDAAIAFSSSKSAWLPYTDRKGNVVGAVSEEVVIAMCANGSRSNASIGTSVSVIDKPIVQADTPASSVTGDAIVIGVRGGVRGIIVA